MKEWEVTIFETVRHMTTVEADNEDDAYEAAHKVITGEVKGEYDSESDGFTGNYYIDQLETEKN